MTEKMTASTANYLWSLGDVLGQGATASVYKARNKRTGEQVAVKVFNHLSYSRPYEVQMREFEMLRRLDHKTIVKLFSVEELSNKQKVLVMEYCSGGSLLSLLEEPENAFGLPETEFLIVLQCVVQGMNHLRENGVVHRDIKPGNIMRQVGEDGRSVYKLTDFGAARELEDDEKFVSIYGTEEYLHPDMYERAVLRKPQHKAYGVSVDLWSIGVTLYHAATGSLPFAPYGGPRRNKPTMYKITKEKPVGAIAGGQKVNDGPIEWSYHLPNNCLLSKGLRDQLVPVLAGILEADQEKCWAFDQFFSATTEILQRVSVYLFSLQQATAHRLYIHHYNTAAIFCEEVASQTGVGLEQQHFLFLGHDLSLEGSMKVVNFPSTSPSQPLLLLSRTPETHAGLPFREPEMPNIPSRFDVVADYSFSKLIVGGVYQYLRIVRSMHTHRELFLHGYYSYMEKVGRECGDSLLSISMVNMRLHSCLSSEHRLHTLGQFPLQAPESTDDSKKLRLIRENLPVYAGGIREFQTRLEHLHVELAKHSENLSEDNSIQKMEVLLEKIMAIHQQYRKDRLTGKLAYNDEQIHKFEKLHLSSHIKRVKVLFREECLQKYRDLLASASTWSSVLREMQCRLSDFGIFSRGLMGDLELCEERQNKFLDRVLLRVQPGQIGPGGQEATPRDKDHMVLRMQQLKEEMEIVVRELQSNNNIIESLGAVTSATMLEPDLPSPIGL
ncbi:inhibitor of nuclear factor kappa-B kinase subunit epsilon isoform X1 [Salvelinus fontinalis]|uniref:inhibitor of nuclear factor kappa-B kinase subunit epsilon isoform X1 n=2 Tax=Salvelinus fontinalis TaxID=8038 RepID=UPI002485BD55|nr:inhibitor of nuclear factor kappa-B kinase subunit epsilon isoform X1 [Salvelinus fontinalis]XP_055773456.1 inhibitor of nuclear factor kappa-B kinase subunit epsilon isoform X1 [Salvelinus fontinalis]